MCELYSLAGITKKERIPELSPAIYSSQSEDEETPGPSQHSEQSAQNRNPPDLSPAFSVLRPQERVAPNSTQSKLDDSESDETVIPSTFPSAIPKKRTLTKSWSSQYQTQTESTSQKRQASRMNETNLFDFSADEEAGPSRTILTSLKTLSQRKRSPLTGKTQLTFQRFQMF